ncbi:MAG: zf-HC2 domain-containing protein [Planctomycetota bacterium]
MSEHEQYQILMMGFLDNELPADDARRFREHAYQCAECAAELVKYQKLAALASAIKLKEPADYEWDRFWNRLYNRMERMGGWVLLCAGVVLLIGYVLYELLTEPAVHMLLKAGMLCGGVGLALLFISVVRARLRTARYDKYAGVKR